MALEAVQGAYGIWEGRPLADGGAKGNGLLRGRWGKGEGLGKVGESIREEGGVFQLRFRVEQGIFFSLGKVLSVNVLRF